MNYVNSNCSLFLYKFVYVVTLILPTSNLSTLVFKMAKSVSVASFDVLLPVPSFNLSFVV